MCNLEHQSKLHLQLWSKGPGFRSSKFGNLVFLPPECAMPWSLTACVLPGGLGAAIVTILHL